MLIANTEHTFGCDPEVFLAQGGDFKSAHNLIPGTKEKPYKVDKGALQVDGMAAEFNIDPASSYTTFQENIDGVIDTLKSMVSGYDIIEQSTVKFDLDFLLEQPLESIQLGCEPDFNAYTMSTNEPPDITAPLRTAGGHAHIGGFDTSNLSQDEHFCRMSRLTRIIDETLGVYSLLWDYDDERRSMYGKAGAFRPKSYGMEYRSLSNKWIFNKKITEFVYNSLGNSLRKFYMKDYEPNKDVREIIDSSDRKASIFNNATSDFVRGLI